MPVSSGTPICTSHWKGALSCTHTSFAYPHYPASKLTLLDPGSLPSETSLLKQCTAQGLLCSLPSYRTVR